jgi:tetratricopeptide (TPR) repeat protein
MTCTSCHDPHSQGYRDVQGRPLNGRDDDRQCTSCHASKASDPSAHTKHPPRSAGSRCVACHMPYLQEPATGNGIRYARSDHAIPVPRPLADSALGVRSACALCHTDRSEGALDAQVTAWYGSIKPVDETIASVMTGFSEADAGRAAPELLHPTSSHTAALFAGLARFADRYLSPDMAKLDGDAERRLLELTGHPDVDVQALSLASLHLARGDVPAIRERLAAQLRSAGSNERALRARWAVSLGYFADKLRGAGSATGSITTYRKAAEVDPTNARVHLNLGLAHAAAGQHAEAISAYQRALALDARQPLAWVNLGIAQFARNDTNGAARSFQRALDVSPREPLAHFNLANVWMASGNVDSAAAGYQRSIDNDPSLALPRFLLARILAQRGELARALTEVEAGLEFEPANAEALSARAQLRRALGGAR